MCSYFFNYLSIAHTYQPPPPGCPEDTTPDGMLASYMQTLNQEDLRDMVVCEAIRRSVGELDGEVRRFSNAGTFLANAVQIPVKIVLLSLLPSDIKYDTM